MSENPLAPDVEPIDESEVTEEVREFADDFDATLGKLGEMMDESATEEGPMGMSPVDMMGMFRPQVRQKALQDPDKLKRSLAIIHMASGDLLEKHHSGDFTDLI